MPVPVPVDDGGRGALERRCTVLSEDRSTAGLHAPAVALALAARCAVEMARQT